MKYFKLNLMFTYWISKYVQMIIFLYFVIFCNIGIDNYIRKRLSENLKYNSNITSCFRKIIISKGFVLYKAHLKKIILN